MPALRSGLVIEMSTNLTTARDRAIETGAAALVLHVNDQEPDDGANDLAGVVVDAAARSP
jgi:hypothetical protein